MLSRSNWNLEMLVFVERGKPEKTLGAGSDKHTKQIQPTYDVDIREIEPGPHWWEVSALTRTAPSLLPRDDKYLSSLKGMDTLLSKAFDIVHNFLLLYKLEHYGI